MSGVDGVSKAEAARAQRSQDERMRVASVKRLGAAPIDCGPAIVSVAPARKAVTVTTPRSMVPTGEDGYKQVAGGYRDRKSLRIADAFDLMNAQAKRANKGKGEPLFEADVVALARSYRDLVERCDAAGVKCSSAFQVEQSGGGGSDFMDAFMADRQDLRRCLAAVGVGASMIVRRVRPSDRGSKVNITDPVLVRMVCISDKTLSEVLRCHGWAECGKNRIVLRDSLTASIERMRVYLH